MKFTLFPPTSRYTALRQLLWKAQCRTVILCAADFAVAGNFALLQYRVVKQGDRLDNITANYLDDPEQFWRICDANDAMRPDELTETVGRSCASHCPKACRLPLMLEGIHLTLMIGPRCPFRLQVVMDALPSVRSQVRRTAVDFSSPLPSARTRCCKPRCCPLVTSTR